MTADPTGLTGDEMLRKAREFNDYTFLYTRRNGDGREVRDARFVDDCPDLATATIEFAASAGTTDVTVCGVLRGHVRTVDDFEYAIGPTLDNPAYRRLLNTYNRQTEQHSLANQLLVTGSEEPLHPLNRKMTERRRFTVICSWDTGDGRKRYSRRVHAVNAEHAELIVLDELTEGEVLIAGVVNGHPILEDRDLTWATVSGEPAEDHDDDDATGVQDERLARNVVLAGAAAGVAIVVLLIIVVAFIAPHL